MKSFKRFYTESLKYIGDVKKIIDIFNKNEVEYMVIGTGAATFYGFNHITEDLDLYPEDSEANNKKIIKSLNKLGFNIDKVLEKNIMDGKDFIQLNKPMRLDIIFYPDGFSDYQEAKKYKKFVEHVPVMNINGLIKSKKSANRPKDKFIMQKLLDFKEYLNEDKHIEEYRDGKYQSIEHSFGRFVNRVEGNEPNYQCFTMNEYKQWCLTLPKYLQ